MKGKRISLLLAAAAGCLLCGCSALEREYVSVRDYVPAVQEQTVTDGRLTAHSYAALKSTLLRMAYAGQTHGSIVFDSAYDGDVDSDLDRACREVRAEDALCAYCVQNFSYEIGVIGTVSQAEVTVSYSALSTGPQEIRHLGFSTEAEEAVLEAFQRGDGQLTLLISRSSFSAEEMAARVVRTYRDNPTVLPKEPSAEVKVFSGSGSQRLYEIRFDYGVSQRMLRQSRDSMAAFRPFAELNIESMSEVDRAYTACRYLLDNCEIVAEGGGADSAYAALIEKRGDSEGMAFGYIELCRQLGIDCRIVYGQLDWEEHCWNIIRVGENYYHVDITQCARGGPALGFLRNDESLWGVYRWDVAAYPKCEDSRGFFDFFPPIMLGPGDADEE